MPANTTGRRSGNSATSDSLPPIASTVFLRVDGRKSLLFFEVGDAVLADAQLLGHENLGEFARAATFLRDFLSFLSIRSRWASKRSSAASNLSSFTFCQVHISASPQLLAHADFPQFGPCSRDGLLRARVNGKAHRLVEPQRALVIPQ